MDEFNVKEQSENTPKTSKGFWKIFGIIILSILLAVLTVVVVNSKISN